jgi:hypothetical protein
MADTGSGARQQVPRAAHRDRESLGSAVRRRNRDLAAGALERLVSDPESRLSKGLGPPPGGWRAAVRAKATLPQYPMVLHRGGFPDGS